MRIIGLVLLVCANLTLAAEDIKPVKVFILAGQSNMEGKAKVSLWDYQASQPATADRAVPRSVRSPRTVVTPRSRRAG